MKFSGAPSSGPVTATEFLSQGIGLCSSKLPCYRHMAVSFCVQSSWIQAHKVGGATRDCCHCWLSSNGPCLLGGLSCIVCCQDISVWLKLERNHSYLISQSPTPTEVLQLNSSGFCSIKWFYKMFSFAEAAEGTSLQGRIAHRCLRGRMVADRDISTDDRQGPSHSVHTSDWGLNTVTD